MSISRAELDGRLAAFEPVAESDVTALLDGSSAERAQALRGLALSDAQTALTLLAQLAELESYDNERTLTRIRELGPIAGASLPTLDAFKAMTLAAARKADVERTLATAAALYALASLPMAHGVDAFARRAMRFLHDAEIETAIERVAWAFAPIEIAPKSLKPRAFIVVSEMNDESAVGLVCRAWARALRERGWDIGVVCTAPRSSFAQTRLLEGYLAEGFELIFASEGTYAQRIESLLAAFARTPAHLAYFALGPTDVVGKLLGDLGIARTQIAYNFARAPHVGRYDFIVNGNDRAQETTTRWSGKERYLGSLIANAAEIDRAAPFDYRTINVPADSVVLGTFGPVERCCSPEYLRALPLVLARAPNAYLVIAGPIEPDHAARLAAAFQRTGTVDRLRVLGAHHAESAQLLRGLDLYCDTMPFPGGHSVLEAMQAGLPIVAARRSIDPEFDPSGLDSTSAVGESLLSPHVERAAAGDAEAYARIALGYIADPEVRRRDGALLGALAREAIPFEGHLEKLDALFREAVSARFGGQFASAHS